MIRLFASDMGGTLLNDKGYISDRTINAVKKLQKHGIHFIVNTGRDYHAAKRELDAASLSCDMICHSGACTYDVHGNGFHITSLPKSIAKQILTVLNGMVLLLTLQRNMEKPRSLIKIRYYLIIKMKCFLPLNKKVNYISVLGTTLQ